MPQQGHERLSSRVDAHSLPAKCQRPSLMEERRRRQLTQQRFSDGQRQTGISARHGVTHPIALGGVEEQHLVRLCYSLVVPEMAHVSPAIGKDEFGGVRTLFRILLPATTLAKNVADRNCRRLQ